MYDKSSKIETKMTNLLDMLSKALMALQDKILLNDINQAENEVSEASGSYC